MSFLEPYMKFLDSATWLPEPFKIASGLNIISALVRGKIYTEHSVTRYFPNLYCLLVGDSGSGKGVAIEKTAKRLLERISPSLILGDRFTPEGFYKKLAEMEEAKGVIYNDEMDSMVNGKKYMLGFTTNLIEIYNNTGNPVYTIRYSKDEFEINNPYVCVFTGIQPASLSKVMNSTDITSGYLPRWWIVWGDSTPRKPTVLDNTAYEQALNTARKFHMLIEAMPVEVKLIIDTEATDAIYEFTEAVKIEYQDENVFKRLSDVIFKLSMIFAIDRIIDTYVCTKSVHCCKCPDYVQCKGNGQSNLNGLYNIDNLNSHNNIYINPPSTPTPGTFPLDRDDTLTLMTHPQNGANEGNEASSVSRQSEASRMSEKEIYKADIQAQSLEFAEAIGYESITLSDVNRAVGLIDLERMMAVANRISTEIDAVMLQKVRDMVIKIVNSDNLITTADGKRLIPQRILVRNMNMTVHRLKPYMETLVIDNIVKPLSAYHHMGKRPVNVYEVVPDGEK